MEKTFVTIIPAFRISTNIKPEVRVFSQKQSNLDINIIKNNDNDKKQEKRIAYTL